MKIDPFDRLVLEVSTFQDHSTKVSRGLQTQTRLALYFKTRAPSYAEPQSSGLEPTRTRFFFFSFARPELGWETQSQPLPMSQLTGNTDPTSTNIIPDS